MKKWFYISCLSMCLLLSCNKHIIEEYPSEVYCEKFAGKYQMYEPYSQESYVMEISCHCDESYIEDTLVINNFANMYNVSYPITKSGIYIPEEDTTDLSWTDGGFFYGIENESGSKTALSVGGPWFGFDTKINRLIADSIFMRYESNNAAFYVSEGVPFESFSVITRGVKIH